MPATPSADVEHVIQAAPIIQVSDPKATAEYYRDVLGFTCDFGSESYTVAWRENAAVHFSRGDEQVAGVRLFIWVKDADAILQEFRRSGANLTVEIGDRDYGVRDFGVQDCNGLDLVIGQAID